MERDRRERKRERGFFPFSFSLKWVSLIDGANWIFEYYLVSGHVKFWDELFPLVLLLSYNRLLWAHSAFSELKAKLNTFSTGRRDSHENIDVRQSQERHIFPTRRSSHTWSHRFSENHSLETVIKNKKRHHLSSESFQTSKSDPLMIQSLENAKGNWKGFL